MYKCKDPVCDPICDFCWYCIHEQECGAPVRCVKNKSAFDEGFGYCDDFTCSIHEPKPDGSVLDEDDNS